MISRPSSSPKTPSKSTASPPCAREDSSSIIDELKKAHKWYTDKVLTEEEFNIIKQKILNSH
jgi:hypothetical protein